MKKLIVLISLLFVLKLTAQDSQLFEQTWLLHELNIDDDILTAPNPAFNNELFIINNPNGNDAIEITHGSCDGGYGMTVESYGGEESFTVSSFGAPFGEECNSPDLEEFLQAHGRLFYGDPVTGVAFNPFTYEITTSGDESTLVITNGNGDVATYGNFTLSLPENLPRSTKILYSAENQNISFLGLEQETLLSIYNLNGQKLLDATVSPSETVNVSILPKGVYFATVSNSTNQRMSRKFVKY